MIQREEAMLGIVLEISGRINTRTPTTCAVRILAYEGLWEDERIPPRDLGEGRVSPERFWEAMERLPVCSDQVAFVYLLPCGG